MDDQLHRDAATGLVMRRDFDRMVEWEVRKSADRKGSFTLICLDIDQFHQIRLTHGEEVAEVLLRRLTDVFRGGTRQGDVISRGVADQFFLLLPDTRPEQGFVVIEDVRRLLTNSTLKIPGRSEALSLQCTFSAGLATYPKDGADRETLQRKAAAALFRAKSEGRNRVCMAVDEKMVLKANYYARSQLDRLTSLARGLDRTEASLLREAIEDLFDKFEPTLEGRGHEPGETPGGEPPAVDRSGRH
ncbi:MAG: GGDEF domain-containing protein [Candidatus Riflebacteria bacterium]|nr:GGDEF domain-containing protein [Candidatus Riflebacteria bacterium]